MIILNYVHYHYQKPITVTPTSMESFFWYFWEVSVNGIYVGNSLTQSLDRVDWHCQQRIFCMVPGDIYWPENNEVHKATGNPFSLLSSLLDGNYKGHSSWIVKRRVKRHLQWGCWCCQQPFRSFLVIPPPPLSDKKESCTAIPTSCNKIEKTDIGLCL